MVKWIIIVVLIISGAILGYLNMHIKSLENTPSALPPIEAANSVRIVHSYADGIHRYSGQIKLPHSCFAIDTEIYHDPKFNDHIVLSITTKDNLLEQQFCSQIPTRYPFETIAEAPATARLELRIDNEIRPTIITETAWQNPTGTVIVK